MKIIFAIVLLIVSTTAAPVSISNNNIGDIVTVGVGLNAVLSNNVEANIITVLAALLNQQALAADIGVNDHDHDHNHVSNESLIPVAPQVDEATAEDSENKNFEITPEMISALKNIKITPELVEKAKKILKSKLSAAQL
jgi:hypothetical protein